MTSNMMHFVCSRHMVDAAPLLFCDCSIQTRASKPAYDGVSLTLMACLQDVVV